MNGITELARLLKERENDSGYSPMFGTVAELPNIKIRLGDKILLTGEYLTSCVTLTEQDADGKYIHLEKQVVLLPYANHRKYIVIGVVQ